MSLHETIETLKDGLMWIGLSALAAIAGGCVFAFLRRTAHSAVAWVWRSRMWVERFAFIGLLTVSLLFGGGKTNSPPLLLMPLPPSLQQTAVSAITTEEIEQGWRVENVVTNAAVSYAMPTNGVEYMPWTLRGGYETHFPLDLGDFTFPFGTGVVHRLDVLSGGIVESLPRPSYMSICAAREWASVVPGVGRFWWGDLEAAVAGRPPYRGKLLTWENVYAGRDCTEQYNAQIELWSDGNFITRSITATFTPADGGEPLSDSVTFRCIEPLRKLVNSKRDATFPLIMNPSRLVYGTNAVLCVDVNGPFQENEIHWHVKEGPAFVNPTVGKRVVVTPTAPDGVVVVEARFNGDEIQPQFVLPIVQERVLDVRAFVVCDENDGGLKVAMEDNEIRARIQLANFIFRQIGARFNLLGIEMLPNSSQYWNIVVNEWSGAWWWREKSVSRQVRSLMQAHNVSGCINMYFVGNISRDADDINGNTRGFNLPGCVFVSNESQDHALAHELGHVLGLWDCYDHYTPLENEGSDGRSLQMSEANLPISAQRFQSHPRDWGDETGRGFYASSDTCQSILKQFLMYGREDFIPNYSYDIPDGPVKCLNNNGYQAVADGFGKIGATNVKPSNEGVYAK